MKRVRKYTEFRLEVVNFCSKHGITKEKLAQAAGVRYSTLIGAGVDRAAGHQLMRDTAGESPTLELRKQELKLQKDEVRALVREEISSYLDELGRKESDQQWQKEQLKRVKELGITDGSRPLGLATRLETAIMAANSNMVKRNKPL